METYGGAERVTAVMAGAFPDAEVVSLLARDSVIERMGLSGRVRTLLPPTEALFRRYRTLAPVYPALTDLVRLDEADVLLTSSYAFVHRFRTRNDAPQVCYCHSPLRFAWSMKGSYKRQVAGGLASRAVFDAVAAGMREADRRSSRRVHTYLTQSPFVADQIERFYGRVASVIGAPVDTELFAPDGSEPEDWFLLCGRLLEPYKQPSVAIDAFRRMPGRRLVVVGDGPALERLRREAPPNVEFTGHLGDRDVAEAMRRCRAAIFPSRDDFGLVPVEVMASGRPVLAYAGGGALHTVIEGVTGSFFERQNAADVEAAVRAFDSAEYDPALIRAHALQWDTRIFCRRLVAAVEDAALERQHAFRRPLRRPLLRRDAIGQLSRA
jgi:glycosyltransferase involved in cell wall biosynthesis